MDNKLRKAIWNNNGLYEVIFNQHHLSFQATENVWYSLEVAPPLYSNLITRSPA